MFFLAPLAFIPVILAMIVGTISTIFLTVGGLISAFLLAIFAPFAGLVTLIVGTFVAIGSLTFAVFASIIGVIGTVWAGLRMLSQAISIARFIWNVANRLVSILFAKADRKDDRFQGPGRPEQVQDRHYKHTGTSEKVKKKTW
ncbi:hypothetical protein BJ508DRAFT_378119 [Ascobolus immersus RN42]|uniref:Uncharacterized protein n=1 Tax=Ascobolus immersus RN42 TaxID=1160509 RepID=A0A3N4I3W9_ASCIM|nr:hypothetical protein BJ508DRAFT_378119 [Ascobolus immersus RN42]